MQITEVIFSDFLRNKKNTSPYKRLKLEAR